ncbi:MAG: hypothetical protein JWN28_929 [Candidatus Saccharibacteria bacterium]|nr:hypothetical protein [Candidatus Saccharibacteria bacterium]
MKNISINKQSGAVSLFVVVFFMLLVTVVTVSFLRLMISDQQQASNNDLSQSAFDSAQAGVEDAKRALLKYKQDCFVNRAGCSAAANAISTNECNGALTGISGNGATGPNGKTKEIMVQQSTSGSDAALDQAYTCVTISLMTADYTGNLAGNQSQLVPLISGRAFDRVQVEWFSREDITASGPTAPVSLTGVSGTGQPLLAQGQWPVNRPPIIRSQLIQFARTFTMSDFDMVSGDQSNSATMFLYPTSQLNIGDRAFTDYDQRKTDAADDPNKKDRITTPTAVSCESSLTDGGFACSSILLLPEAVGASGAGDRTAFLRLTPLYNATHFRVTLWNGPFDPDDPIDLNNPSSPAVSFKEVQPAIDSTGRANDVFRRVVSRVNLFDTTFPYPDATVNVTGDFCKDFSVTDIEYIPSTTTCNP